MADPTQSTRHLEVTVVRGDGDRRAVMLQDIGTQQSVMLLLSDHRDADRAIWQRMRRHVSNPTLRQASDQVVNDADAARPDWSVRIETETPPASTGGDGARETRTTGHQRRWWLSAAALAGICTGLAASLIFDLVLGAPFDVSAAGRIGAAVTGASIVLAAAVVSSTAVRVMQMRETSAMADDLAHARAHLGAAAEQLAIVHRFRDLKKQSTDGLRA